MDDCGKRLRRAASAAKPPAPLQVALARCPPKQTKRACAGPCAVTLPSPRPKYADDLCGFLTVPADAVAANVVRWMTFFGVERAAVRLGVVPGGGSGSQTARQG
jgi:hypothetical protein